MVDGIGPTNTARIAATANVGKVTRASLLAKGAATGKTPNPAADLAAFGAPFDAAKVEQLKKAIATGSYHADPQAIADKMIALDLPAAPAAAPATPAATGKGGSGTGK